MFTHTGKLFSERIVNAWNFLSDIVDFSSLTRFKRSIHKGDFSRFLKCNCVRVFFKGHRMFLVLHYLYLCFWTKKR